jgi:hypothetical protein
VTLLANRLANRPSFLKFYILWWPTGINGAKKFSMQGLIAFTFIYSGWFLEPNYTYVTPTDTGWRKFETSAADRKSPETEMRVCLSNGDRVQLSGKLVVSASKICGLVIRDDPYRIEKQCHARSAISHLGIRSRKLVVGTPAGPDPCPSAE